MKTLIIIPTYNEKENIQLILEHILRLPIQSDILIVDDGSPDGTSHIVEMLMKDFRRLKILKRSEKMGLGKAYVAGFEWGLQNNYDGFIQMDADFSHHPDYLVQIIDLLSVYDVVIGSRYVSGGGTKNWGLFRRLLSQFGGLYARTILSAPIQDFTGGFNAWRKDVLQDIALKTLQADGYAFQIELKYRAYLKQFKYFELPILFEDRKVGNSKMNYKIIFEALLRVIQFRFFAKRHLTLSQYSS